MNGRRKIHARRRNRDFRWRRRWRRNGLLCRFFCGCKNCKPGGGDLLFEFRDFAPEIGGLTGLLQAGVVKVCAQFSVFPQKVKCKEWSDDHKYQEEDGYFDHRLWVSLVVPDLRSADLDSMLER